MVHPLVLLRWLYLGRMTLAAGIFGGAFLVWRDLAPEISRLATLVLVVPLLVTLGSAWYSFRGREVPGSNFLYVQVVFDAFLVTAIVHLTGGPDSNFAPLYILVIAAGALLLPLPGGMLIGALASILYFADIVWAYAAIPPWTVFGQIVLFAIVALVTGYLGDRLRQTGVELGMVESELRRLRLDTNDILDTIDTGVVTVDASGRLVYVNRAAASLLRLDGARLRGQSILEELGRRSPGLATLIRRTAVTRRPMRRYETRIVEEDGGGSERVIGARATVLEREGEEEHGVTVVLQDITDGKRVEELDRRAAKLQAVAELAASLAHEIKNPLASIRSAVEQMTSGQLARSDQEVLQRLVLNESDRLSRLLSDFIEFGWAKLQRPAEVEMGRLTTEAIGLVKRHPDGSDGARIEYDPPADPIVIQGDEDLLHRAIFNLVLNAVQHTPRDGRVRIEVGRVLESEIPLGIHFASPVRVSVIDSGPGIPEDYAARLFDPFFTTRKGGSGLGLALVHRAVEAHRGAIFLDNEPGGGARFTVYLPAHLDSDR